METIKATYIQVIEELKRRGHLVYESIPINEGRYYYIRTDRCRYLCVYKREFFYSFGKIFASEGESGAGETINTDVLKLCIQKNIKKIFFTYPDGKIYSIRLSNFLNYSHKRVNDFEEKETRSISIKYLNREL